MQFNNFWDTQNIIFKPKKMSLIILEYERMGVTESDDLSNKIRHVHQMNT